MRLFLAALALAAVPALAQTATLTPGDALDTGWMADGETRYVLRLVEPMQQDIGTAVERTTVADGVVTRVVRLSIPMRSMTTTDSLRAEAGTLAPLTHHSTGGPKTLALEFAPEGVVGMAGTDPVTEFFDAPAFDGSWVGEIAQSLPLAEGYAVEIAAYDGMRGMVTYTLTVTGQETVQGADGPTPAWTVVASSGDGPSATYTIDATTRAMVRTRFSPQPGVTVEIARR